MRKLNRAALAKTKGNSDLVSFEVTAKSLNLWKGMVEDLSELEKNIVWGVENGARVNFWLDAWLFLDPLITLALVDIRDEDLCKTVDRFWTDTSWKLDELVDRLPVFVIDKLRAHHLCSDEEAKYGLRWSLMPSGIFTVKNSYWNSMQVTNPAQDRIWKDIWKVKVP